MAKAHCPGCGAGMKAKRRFCGDCGRRNPLFASKGGQAVKAVRPVLVKADRPATVTEIRRGQLLGRIHAETNPDQREVYTRQLTDLLRGGAA
jgi:hypothetical protein